MKTQVIPIVAIITSNWLSIKMKKIYVSLFVGKVFLEIVKKLFSSIEFYIYQQYKIKPF